MWGCFLVVFASVGLSLGSVGLSFGGVCQVVCCGLSLVVDGLFGAVVVGVKELCSDFGIVY